MSSAAARLQTVPAPTPGLITVHPMSGVALSTNFVVNLDQWMTPEEFSPLSYSLEYHFINVATNAAISSPSLIWPSSRASNMTLLLPYCASCADPATSNARLVIIARVMNTAGVTSVIQSNPISIAPPSPVAIIDLLPILDASIEDGQANNGLIQLTLYLQTVSANNATNAKDIDAIIDYLERAFYPVPSDVESIIVRLQAVSSSSVAALISENTILVSVFANYTSNLIKQLSSVSTPLDSTVFNLITDTVSNINQLIVQSGSSLGQMADIQSLASDTLNLVNANAVCGARGALGFNALVPTLNLIDGSEGVARVSTPLIIGVVVGAAALLGTVAYLMARRRKCNRVSTALLGTSQ
eukprot:TRINITY_DN8122_c0_g2_i1.p1 TRINITY_DN8122_c0_g2~~TRINITY_DN8122_c0_g2_i1.p1  ORF type:complete len:393 (+),score=85.54 TRINITY_DN8122_c0_g2_i1:112-1179(+)